MGGDLDRTERCSARRSTSLGRGGREGYLAQLSPTAAAGEADESTSEGEELGGDWRAGESTDFGGGDEWLENGEH